LSGACNGRILAEIHDQRFVVLLQVIVREISCAINFQYMKAGTVAIAVALADRQLAVQTHVK